MNSYKASIRGRFPASRGTSYFLLAIGVALIAAAGCKKDPPGKGLLQPGELKRLEDQLVTELRANQTRSCPRPVLRGKSTGGRADADLVALAEARGPLAPCAAAARRAEKALLRTLRVPKPPKGWLARELPYARPLDEKASPSDAAAIEGLAAACQALPAAIARAASHHDACSPYLPGRREMGSMVGFIRLSRAAALLARRRARKDPAGAARLLLDLIRVGQDLSRGGPSWIAPMVAVATLVDVATTLEEILAQPGLSRADLESLGRELALLEGTEPRLSLYLRGERQSSELDFGLKLTKGKGWTLPGLASDSPPAQSKSNKAARRKPRRRRFRLPEATPYTGSKMVDRALAWIAFRRALLPLESVCKAARTPHGCVVAARARSAQQSKKAAASREVTPKSPAQMRERILGILGSIASPAHARYIRRAARRGFLVAAMRLHVAARLLRLRTGKAPGAREVMGLPEAKREPFAGKPFRVNASPAGIVLASSEKISDRKPLTYLIRGP